MSKFPKSREAQLESVVDRWLFFFRYAEETIDKVLKRIEEIVPKIKLAYNELDRFIWNEKDLIAYEEGLMDLQKKAGILKQKLDDATEKDILIGKKWQIGR